MLKHPADKNKKIRLLLLAFLFIVIGLLFYQKLFIFLVIMLFSGALQYFSHRQQLKLNLGHTFFFALVTVRQIGVIYGILLVIMAEFLPKVIVGDMELRTIISLPISILLMFLFGFFGSYNFTAMAFIFAIINYGLIFFISRFSGDPMPEKLLEIGLPFLLNIIYIISLSGPVINLVGNVISA